LGVPNVVDTIIEWELYFVLSLSSAIFDTLPFPGIENVQNKFNNETEKPA
jgi:hypothetical protein